MNAPQSLVAWQFTLVVLLVKLTLVLTAAWLLNACLARANPRWRRLLWRATACGAILLAAVSALPPLYSWAILPEGTIAADVAEEPVSAPHGPLSSAVAVHRAAVRADSNAISPPPAARPPGGFSFAPKDAPGGPYPSSRSVAETREPATALPAPRVASPPAIPPTTSAATAVQPPPRSSWLIRVPVWLVAVWCGGVVVLLVQTLVGVRELARIRRRAASAPESVIRQAAEIAARLGCRVPAVRVTDEIASPCLVGVRHPVVLLPRLQCEKNQHDELPAILAHEIAHVRGGDCAWHLLVHAVSIACWFHPLAWRMRLAHLAACDAVCDCVAADHVGSAAAYGQTLARLAIRLIAPRKVVGMPMAQRSGVRRRIEALQRRLFREHLRRGPACLSLAVAFALCCSLGLLALVPAAAQAPNTGPAQGNSPEPTKPQDPQAAAIAIRVSDEAGQPLAGASLRFRGRINDQRFNRRLSTDEEGRAELKLPADPQVENLWMTCEKSGRVPVGHTWQSDHKPIELPAQLDLKLAPGTTIGGIVTDEQGRPVEDADLDITMPMTWPRLAHYVFTAASLKTDAQGRWSWNGAPEDARSVSIRIEHPDFRRAYARGQSDEGITTVLRRGLSLSGHVTDDQGRPVESAMVREGFDRFGTDKPETTTDAQGRFTLVNCEPGRSLVTVQADNFAPQLRQVTIARNNDDVDFKLQPGHTLRVCVVDVAGRGIPQATFCTDTWRNFRSLALRVQTDAEGRAEWHSAPDDAILCDVFKDGYMSTRRTRVTASDEETVITLHPELVISGKVTDAAGKPVEHFRVRQGQIPMGGTDFYWGNDAGTPFSGGVYTYKFDEPLVNGHFLRIEAPGYAPADSRSFRWDEGPQTYDFRLKPADGPAGVVVDADGKPLAGAEVAVATRQSHISLAAGYLTRDNTSEVAKTDAQGRFKLLPRGGESFLLVAVHDAGYAEATSEQFAKNGKLMLRPWGRIEGVVMVGRKPDVNREIHFWPRTGAPFGYIFNYGYTARTDDQGRFHFDRVISGPGQVTRITITDFGGGSQQHAPGWPVPVDVPAEGTVSVLIGGTGRPVTGRVQLEHPGEVTVDWTANEPVDVKQATTDDAESRFRAAGNLDKSGHFNIPDVPAGNYQLTLSVNNPRRPNACGAGAEIGRATFDFVVPPMDDNRSDEPLELGTITAELFDTLDVGETAPDFVLPGFNGDTIRLSALRGKLVLIDFWATWCKPCLNEMPALTALHKQFAGNPRFAMLGLSVDQGPEMARKYTEENSLPWPNAQASGGIHGVMGKYTVRELPANFLIGPDGRVLAKNLHGDDLRSAIAVALEDDQAFAAAKDAPPPVRFPVVRFETPKPGEPSGRRPAVVVLDDADPEFKGDGPHHDTLHAYGDDGGVLWSLSGLNNAGSVGAIACVALDRRRGRVYVCEGVPKRVTALDFRGQKLWQVEHIEADAVAVDDETGNLWCTGGRLLNQGETVVLDPQGNEIAAYPVRGIDIAYDPHAGAMLLAGYENIRIARTGEVKWRLPVKGWCCATVAVNPNDGSAWFGERDHPDVDSRNRLWLVDTSGNVRQKIDLGDYDPFALACQADTGDAWVADLKGELRRISTGGKTKSSLPLKGNPVESPTTGVLWMATPEALLELDSDGKTLLRQPFDKPPRQSWLVAF